VIAAQFIPKRIAVVSPKRRDLDPLRSAPARIDWTHVPSQDLTGVDFDSFDAVLVLADDVPRELVRFVFLEVQRHTSRPLLGVHHRPDLLEELTDVSLPSPQSRRDVLIMTQRITRIVYSIEDDGSSRRHQWSKTVGLTAMVAVVPAVIMGIQTGDPVLAAETAGAVLGTVLLILSGQGIRSRTLDDERR
tara:strand:+ start:657 stop:1226 length:570 start_codon:yes stop_codon:yes gene_type:complete